MAGFEARQGGSAAGFGPKPERSYLRARATKTPDKAFLSTKKIIDDWHTRRIKMALGQEFRLTTRILLKRPKLMPNALFMWLLRSIIIETAPPEEKERR